MPETHAVGPAHFLGQADAVRAAADHATSARIEDAIDAAGRRFWNGGPMDRTEAARRFAAQGARTPPPAPQLRADRAVPYGVVAASLADAAKAGLAKVAFVSPPEPH